MTRLGYALSPELPSTMSRVSLPTFDELYEAHFAFVWRTLRRLGVQPANVADAAQDVFVVVGRRLGDLTAPELARSFVYGIVVRVAHAARRAQARNARTDGDGPSELADECAPNAHDEAERSEDLELLDQLLATLDADKREVLVLVELEELSAPEVSELLGVKLNTVYSRLRAARAAFDAALSRHRARLRSKP